MRGIKSGRARQLRLPLAAARTWGGARKGAGRKSRGRPRMPHVTRRTIDPRYPVQVTIRGMPGLPSFSLTAGVRGAPGRHRASVGRSLSRDPLLDSAGPRPLHRRGGRAAPRPWRCARAGDPVGAGGEPRAWPERKGRGRPLPRPAPHDAAADAGQHDLHAAELPEAPEGAGVHRPAQLGAALFGLAATAGGERSRAGHRAALHLDGAVGLAARWWTVARGRAPGCTAQTPPDLIRRMFRKGRAVRKTGTAVPAAERQANRRP
jgi:hypothetical protein